jgi:hypothetical protein
MKKLTLIAAIVGSLAGATLTAAPAIAREAFTFSFDTGAVAFAYSDGYWDRDRQWHSWRNAREAREYRARYSQQYRNKRHTRERNQGWRGDQDRDGIPNRVDRDRDGDGVSNRRDDSPGNPRRN